MEGRVLQPPNGDVFASIPAMRDLSVSSIGVTQVSLKVGAADEDLEVFWFPSICRTAFVPATDQSFN